MRYFLVSLTALAVLSGCATAQKQMDSQKSTDAGQSQSPNDELYKHQIPDGELQKKQAPAIEQIPMPAYEKARPEKSLPAVEPIDYKKLVHEEKPVMLNAEGMPLSDFILYAIGDTLKVTFFIDQPVRDMKKPITLRMTREMPADQVLEIAVDILRQNDLVVEARAGSLYIMKSRPPANKPVDIKVGREPVEGPSSIIQIVPLEHARASEIAPLINDLYRTNVSVRQYLYENTLLLNGPASAIKDILSFVETVDVPYFSSKKIFLLHLTYWQPEEFVKQMKTILEGIGYRIALTPKDGGILFIPVKFLNSVLIASPDDVTLKVVLDWRSRLDTVEAAGTEEKAFTYTPKFSKASDLVDAMRSLYYVAAPAGAAVTTGTPQPSAQAQAQAQAAAPPQQKAQGQRSSVSAEGLRMAADDKRNVILVSATPSQYRSVLIYLEKLDVPPKQVLIDATIAELTLTDDLVYGFEWYLQNKMLQGSYTLSTLGNLGQGSQGLLYSYISNSGRLQATLNAFASLNKLNVISRPRLMVLDNEEASIEIGTDVPIITSQMSTEATTASNLNVLQSVQYRTTGTILKIKPNINTEGLLTLNISEEESQAQTNNVSSISSPLIETRNISTTVVASSGQAILLGGFMETTDSTTDTKVPLLGDIPLIGNIFKTVSKSKIKTELIIMITPTILTGTEDAAHITSEISKQLEWLHQ